MKVLLQEQGNYATSDEWSQAICPRLEPPSVTLRSYGGGHLNVVPRKDAPCEGLTHSLHWAFHYSCSRGVMHQSY